MNWNSGDEPSYDTESGGTLESLRTDLRPQSAQSHEWQHQSGAGSSSDIQLLNDDQEKAILSDLCKTADTGSTPLTTFSYITISTGQLYASADLFKV
ncbi:uncharacterized protein LOC118505256 isoform X2 [Anopheles stephensi]|uniref:uncharacterized protein LOC118505256 isoform X2 n=1 Tax=Anopheles stephensi TaxID=30069 RepID=UPI0016589D71|nr:uncharacterized protein LOC118505256 isoform X2 [Anopheles stephensi]